MSNPRPHKYRAKPITVDGCRFDSQSEAKRYGELKLLERAGEISRLELQPVIECTVNGVIVCRYRGDFGYFDNAKSASVIEDVKGVKTPVYRLKKKLVEALYPGVRIVEVPA